MIHRPRFFVFALVVVTLGLRFAWASRNLALGKSVRMSSVLIGSPAGVVNGSIEWGTYAVHSRHGSSWIEIDLGSTFPMGMVRVVGRGDGFHTDSSQPMAVERSVDGKNFVNAGYCGTVLTQVAPCSVNLGGAAGRYVRISHPTHLVLSEVEVFRGP